jgi:hypothetical protein
MNREAGKSLLHALPIFTLFFSVSMIAQVRTETKATQGPPTREVTVERGEIVYVSGNDLVVKMEDGSLRNFLDLPDSDRVTVDGKELGIHELKPGMKLEKTLTVTTTPQTITTVQKVTGKVWHVSPPHSVILRLEDGSTQRFTVPLNQKFTINGEETDVWGLRKGMAVTATKIVEEPTTVVEHEKQLAGTMPAPPPIPPPDVPILIAILTPMPDLGPVSSAAARTELPKTASILPLFGLLGVIAIGFSFLLAAIRRITRHPL